MTESNVGTRGVQRRRGALLELRLETRVRPACFHCNEYLSDDEVTLREGRKLFEQHRQEQHPDLPVDAAPTKKRSERPSSSRVNLVLKHMPVGVVLTRSEVAERAGISVASAAYHLRRLRETRVVRYDADRHVWFRTA